MFVRFSFSFVPLSGLCLPVACLLSVSVRVCPCRGCLPVSLSVGCLLVCLSLVCVKRRSNKVIAGMARRAHVTGDLCVAGGSRKA